MVVGVDVGGTKMAGAVVARDSSVLASLNLHTPKEAEPLLDALADLVRRLCAASPEPVRAVGVGLPSTIDAGGMVLFSTNIDLHHVDAGAELRARIGLPVAIDNDGNLAAMAEHRLGAGRGSDAVVMLTIGTGIGGGVILDGRPMRGGSGTGAELGHMVVKADGPPCQWHCPNHGCLETMASGTAIARDGGAPAEEIVARATAGDAGAVATLERAGQYLGVGLASLANVLNPDVFVIGGGVMGGAGELLLGPARREYRSRALPPNATAPVVPATLGTGAGVLGAALLAADAVA